VTDPEVPEVTKPGVTSDSPPAPMVSTAERDRQFADFYRSRVKQLVGFLIVQGACLADAVEVAQETMTLLYEQWSRVQHPRAWMHRVASRTWIRRQLDQGEELFDELPEPSPLLRSTDIEQWEQLQDILRGLSELSPRQRQVLTWSLFDFTPTEIATELNMQPGTVRQNLSLARRSLSTLLNQKEGGE
jgi:RNA polymerase sigma factor (sigma-70 family)